jgi:hypothetical protein
VGPLFDLLDVFTMRTRVDFAFLQHYLKTTIAETYSLQARRQARSSMPMFLCAAVRVHSLGHSGLPNTTKP